MRLHSLSHLSALADDNDAVFQVGPHAVRVRLDIETVFGVRMKHGVVVPLDLPEWEGTEGALLLLWVSFLTDAPALTQEEVEAWVEAEPSRAAWAVSLVAVRLMALLTNMAATVANDLERMAMHTIMPPPPGDA
ncbi:MAG TPA: hypothetical protein VK610_06635 [Rhodothermales bacterium]|nr:hypothetical protein [Rhodothermales bacterium]